MTDREMIDWKVTLKDSKLMKSNKLGFMIS